MSKKKNETKGPQPAVEAVTVRKCSPLNGVEPPIEHRFKPGQSGNPGGSRVAGAWVTEWYNAMSKWKREDIQAVADDPDSTAAEIGAARQWLIAMSADVTAAGHPVAGEAIDRISDRTHGKPSQHVSVDSTGLVASLDLTRLDEIELHQFRRLLAKAVGKELVEPPALPGGEMQ